MNWIVFGEDVVRRGWLSRCVPSMHKVSGLRLAKHACAW
jgi:hypothetical protein